MAPGGWLMMPVALVVLVGLVALIVSAIRGGGRGRDDEAIEIVRVRYARGETDHEQFTRAMETFGRSAPLSSRFRAGLLLGGGLLIAGLLLVLLGCAFFGSFGGMMGHGMMG